MQLFKLRFFQIKRDLSYWVFILSTAMFFIAKEIANSSATNTLILIGIVWLILYNNYESRKDLNFLSKNVVNYKLQIAINYNILILPISFGFLCTLNWHFIILLHFLIFSIVVINFKKGKQPKFLKITNLFTSSQFEWISGLRKQYFLLSVFLLLSLVLSPVKLFGIVCLFIFNTIIFSFYDTCEPLLMLNPNWLPSEDFLLKKVKMIIKTLFPLNIIILAINSIFNPEIVGLNIVILFSFILIGVCSIYIKYSYYQPNLQYTYKIDFLFLYASIFLPYLLPLSIITYYTSKRKAAANLSNYLE